MLKLCSKNAQKLHKNCSKFEKVNHLIKAAIQPRSQGFVTHKALGTRLAAIYIRKTRNFLKLCFCRRKLLEVAGPNAKSCQKVTKTLPSTICRNKRSVLRRQSRDTNRNIKRSVYCQYG